MYKRTEGEAMVDGRRRRDPERRRQEIVSAAAALVTEVGTAALSHRKVAARAAVPLGSTTQYFATLDDLRNAALEHLSRDIEEYVSQMALAMTDASDRVKVMAQGLHDYLSDPHLVRADTMLSASAVLDPRLRPLTDRWFEGLLKVLAPELGTRAADNVVMLISGATWQAALTGQAPSVETLEHGLRTLFQVDAKDG
jgi:DNA-binding transcriptional regulator YbjK